MMLLLRHQALLVLVAGLLFFVNLGSYGLFNDDESRNAACGAEMYRRGAWIVPTFNGDLKTDQPIFVYWLMLISFRLFGVSEFSARLASSVLAVGTTLLTYHLGRKLCSSRVGYLAAIVLCTCLLFSAYGRAATPDLTVVFFVTMAFTSYVWIVARQRGGNFNGLKIPNVKAPESDAGNASPEVDAPVDGGTVAVSTIRPQLKPLVPATWQLASPMFAAMGLGVLATGLVGVVLPCAAILLFLLISLRRDDVDNGMLKRPEGSRWRRSFVVTAQVLRPRQILEASLGLKLLTGTAIVAAIAVPWYLTIGIVTHGVWPGEFFRNRLEQMVSFRGGHNGFPLYPLYHLVVIHFCFFPWSVFLPVAIYQLWQRMTDDDATWRQSDLLVACWTGVWFVFYSLIGTKLPSDLLPMYPAMALILARYFYDWEWDEVDSGVYSFNICCKALGIAGGVMILGLCVAAYLYFSSQQWIALIGVIPVIGAFVAIRFLDREQRPGVIQTLVVTACMLAILLIGIAPATISSHQDSPIFVADAQRFAGSKDIDLATYDYFEPNLVYYVGKPVHKLDTARDVADFISSHPHAYVITRASKHNDLRDELRGDVGELSRHRNFLGREELILLGRNQ